MDPRSPIQPLKILPVKLTETHTVSQFNINIKFFFWGAIICYVDHNAMSYVGNAILPNNFPLPNTYPIPPPKKRIQLQNLGWVGVIIVRKLLIIH